MRAGRNSAIRWLRRPFLPCREVVGVVRDSRARSLRTEGNEARLMQYYVPFEQSHSRRSLTCLSCMGCWFARRATRSDLSPPFSDSFRARARSRCTRASGRIRR